MLKTIVNAGRVLDLFDAEHPERGVTEVARLLAMPKSQAYSLLASLSEAGLLRRTPDRRYQVGWRVLTLSRGLAAAVEFRRPATRVMLRLAHRLDATVHLAALDGDAGVALVERIQLPGSPELPVGRIGTTLAPHFSAAGKVLLAHVPAEQVHANVERHGLARLTTNTITHPARLTRDLQRIRAQGFAHDLEEACDDFCCVAAPIWDGHRVVAALSVTAPSAVFEVREPRYRAAVVQGADVVTRELRRSRRRAQQ